jgi:hypothetical protein
MQREDRSGIGSFGEECRSLEFEAQMRVNQEEATRKLYRLMSKYGELEDVEIDKKGQVKVRYAHRYYAEFARESLMD